MITSPKLELPSDYDPRDRPWYQDAVENKQEVAITSPYKDASSGEMVVTITKFLSDGSGVVGIDLSISRLEETVKELVIGQKGYAVLLILSRISLFILITKLENQRKKNIIVSFIKGIWKF